MSKSIVMTNQTRTIVINTGSSPGLHKALQGSHRSPITAYTSPDCTRSAYKITHEYKMHAGGQTLWIVSPVH
jgi:hypothetical protein